ncbi:ribonuclease H-like domain-containing protein [Tanacetum coccineum]
MVGPSNSEDLISSLDFGNPRHLENSDFTSNTIVSIKLTGTENYRVSAAAMKLAINTWNKTGFLDGTCVKSAYANLFLGQIFSDNAFEVWSKLKETYDKLDGSIIFNLLQKIHGFKQGELTVSEYYHRLNSLLREFDIMTKLPKCSCAAKEVVSKHNRLIKNMQFLMGLNDVFQPIRSSLLSRETFPDVKDAFAIISREESHRGIASSSSGSVTKPQVSSFIAKSNTWTNNGNIKVDNNKRYNKNPCPKLNGPRTFNVNSVSSSNEKGVSLSFTNEQMMKLMSLINEAPFGTVQANMAANQHMTVSSSNMFGIIDITDYPNGTLAKIKYAGNLKLSDKIILFDVLVVPEYCISLLSMNKLIKDSRIIKTVRSDNGTEFVNNKMNTLFNSLDIVHQTSCAYTPQQNGIAEMKHIHLLNVARSLLFQSGIPLSMWTKCVLTATYLISRLPSSVLNGKSPFELVYGFKPKLSHLRSFGCLCFSYVLNNSDKLSVSNADDCEDVFATSMGDISYSKGNVPSNSTPLSQENFPKNTNQGQPDLRRSSNNVKMLAKFNDYVVNSSRKYGLEKYVTYANLNTSNYCFSINLNKSSEPTSYSEAVKNPNWVEAMNNEIEALNRNSTWTICDLSVGRKELFQLDINNAFLYGDLSEDVYMTLPPGFDNEKSKVCKLNKSLYGLKQAPRQWNAKLTKALIEHGFVQSKFDYSLFTKTSDNVFIDLLVYVDDIVITRNDVNEIEKFKHFLKSKFQIKDLGKLKYFLGIEVLENNNGIYLSQRKYYLELLHEFGLLAAKHVYSPLPKNATLNHIESDDDHLLLNIGNYQRLVGKLIYLTNTRLDISYTVHYLSQFMHSPLNSHLDAALRVLRYLKGSPTSGIQINKNGNLKLRAYADSDWARCPATRKSYVEAKYRSMSSATCEVIWLSNLLGDVGVKNLLPVVMYCDNSSALQIAANLVFHEKSKHFEIDVHLVREKVASGVIKTKKIHTSQQIADIRTKGLDIEQLNMLCEKLGMLDMFKVENLREGVEVLKYQVF